MTTYAHRRILRLVRLRKARAVDSLTISQGELDANQAISRGNPFGDPRAVKWRTLYKDNPAWFQDSLAAMKEVYSAKPILRHEIPGP